MKGIIRSTIFTSRHIAQLLIASRLYFCTNFTTQIPEKKVMGKHRYAKKRTECMWEYTMWKSFFLLPASQELYLWVRASISVWIPHRTHINGSFFFLLNTFMVILFSSSQTIWMLYFECRLSDAYRWFCFVRFSMFRFPILEL